MEIDNSNKIFSDRNLFGIFSMGVLAILALMLLSFQLRSQIKDIKSGDYLKQYVNEELLAKYEPYGIEVKYTNGKKLDAKLTNATIEDGNVIGSLELELKTGEKITLDTYRTTVNLAKSEISEITLTELADYEPSDRSISGIKLKLKTVTSEELADGSVVTNKLANASITGGKIQEGVIETNHMGSAIVTEIKIADGAVTTNKILNGTIISEDLANGSITNSKLSSDSVTTDKIVDGTISNADLANESIDDAKISNTAAISWSKISKIGSSLADLATRNSSDLTIADSGNYFTATNVEDALAELSGYNSLLGSTYLKVDASNGPVTGTLTLQNTANAQELIVKGNSGQTANLQEWQNSSGTVLSSFDSQGNLKINTNSTGILLNIAGSSTTAPMSLSTSVNSATTIRGVYLSPNMIGSALDQGGVTITPMFTPSGNITSVYGLIGSTLIYNNNKNITNAYGIYFKVSGISYTGILTNAYGNYIATSSASPVNSYGLYVESQTGSSLGYGIYTNSGLNRFGDQLSIVGSADRQQLIVKGNSTQTANLTEWQNSSGTVLSGADERGILFSDGGTGISNFFAGADAGKLGATGTNNVGVGSQALLSLTTGSHNFGLGTQTLQSNTSGWSNVAIGTNAMILNVSGSNNVAIGYFALRSSTGGNNTAIGYAALTTATGINNVAIGYQAGGSKTTGSSNIFLGMYSGSRQTTGSNILIIDNQQRADIATEALQSILYGVMGATPAVQTLAINAGVTINPQGAAVIPLVIKGAVTQTANLQEWQNSTGSVLSSISPEGKASLSSLRITTSTTPASGACSNVGDLNWDDSYLYVCTSTGWKRSELITY